MTLKTRKRHDYASALISLERWGQLLHHLHLVFNNTFNEDALLALFTHLSFYWGFPATESAIEDLQHIQPSPQGK